MSLSLAARIKGMALDLLFPPRCVGCNAAGQLICPACTATLSRIAPPVCPLCGKPQPQGSRCPGCWGWQPSIDGIRSPFSFEGTIRQAVHSLKYRNVRALSRPLAELMAQYFLASPLPADILVPVPLHVHRMRERGYNQSTLLARDLGHTLNIPLDEENLLRRKDTPPQARTPSADQRQRNVSGAFAMRSRKLKGKRVLLIDDVCTSGATLDSCARVLKRAGSASVWGFTLAKEI